MPASDRDRSMSSTTEGLPVSPSMGPALDAAHVPPHSTIVDRRTLLLSALGVVLGVFGVIAAEVLMGLIGLITNLVFYGRFSLDMISPAGNHLGLLVVLIPVAGGLIVGVMARFGSAAIRGHGIPEAMEQVLTNESRIPARLTWLKPVSSAIAIGTGGPFGAEGPIIATGGAVGSLLGQIITVTASERKTLLAAGAAAGMAATFGSPLSAILLAIELLLFEYRIRSLVPVAFASVTAAAIRLVLHGPAPIFAMPDLSPTTGTALAAYVVIGAVVGVIGVGITRAVYAVEDGFERLPVHWMWWPAIGAVAVGVIGFFVPRTLGVGYENISDLISNALPLRFAALLVVAKFVSWAISLGSGTSGGTLAPLFTIGAGVGATLGVALQGAAPGLGIDPRVAALVGMAAIFAGASRALLASAVFAFETTLQPLGLLPLIGGCTAAYLVGSLICRESIMTEKIARRGIRVPNEYLADPLAGILVRDAATSPAVTLEGDSSVGAARALLGRSDAALSHQGYPIIGADGSLIGVLTRRDILGSAHDDAERLSQLIHRPLCIVYDDCTLREALDHMVNHDVGRLPVVRRSDGRELIGIITRSDVLAALRSRQ